MRAETPLKFLFRFLGGSIWIALFSIFMSTTAILLGVGLIGTSSYLISYAALQPSISVLAVPIVGVRFFGIAKSLFRYLERLASHEVNFRILADLRVWIYRQIIPRVPFRTTQERTGDLIQLAVDDVDVLEFFFIRVVNPPLTALSTSMVVGIFLGGFHIRFLWTYLLLSSLSTGLCLVAAYLVSSKTSRNILNKQAAVHSALLDYLDGLPDLTVNQAARQRMESITYVEKEYNQIQLNSAMGNASISSLLLVLSQGSMLVMLITGIVLVGQDELNGMLLAVVTLVTLASFDGIQPLPLAAQQAYLSKQAANRILGLTDSEEPSYANPLADPHLEDAESSFPQRKDSEGLVLKNVGFQFKPGGMPVLHDVNLEIHPGSKIAIVGPSGAGKSTLARLLLKFWNPSAGHIHLNGRDYKDWSDEELRNQIGYSGPNPYFFHGTLRENLELIRSGMSEEEIKPILDKVLLTDWYQRLPDGLDSMLGDRGSKMSEGERKRLDLARVLILDRPIILLDEPFANQDIQSQSQLTKALLKESAGKMLIIITHQLNQLDWADEIHVLEAGTVIESGREQTLLQTDSLYRKMWFQQQQIIPADQA